MKPEKRKIFIGGNWKMNLLTSQVSGYAETLTKQITEDGRFDICVCPPYVSLERAVSCFKNTCVSVAAQNVNENSSGAFTGEVSCSQLSDIGVERVMIGHSERRIYYAEANETVNRKMEAAIKAGLSPILCVGETEAVRAAGNAERFVKEQLVSAFDGVPCDAFEKTVIAYEPVWAIGTGKAADAEICGHMCAFIREVLRTLYGECAEHMSIAYGGSVNEENIAGLISLTDIDGALVGGASLSADSFGKIIASVSAIL